VSQDRRPDWAERSAKRRNRRQEERYPLLALSGDLQPVTPDQLRADWEDRKAGWARFEARQERKARLYRFLLARRLDPEALAEVDRQRAACPPSSAYSADVYGCELRRIVRP